MSEREKEIEKWKKPKEQKQESKREEIIKSQVDENVREIKIKEDWTTRTWNIVKIAIWISIIVLVFFIATNFVTILDAIGEFFSGIFEGLIPTP